MSGLVLEAPPGSRADTRPVTPGGNPASGGPLSPSPHTAALGAAARLEAPSWETLAERGVLPAEPLVDLVRQNGGLRSCGVRREEGAALEALAKAYYRARRKGHISLYLADALACKVLRLHPQSVWGELWWIAERSARLGRASSPRHQRRTPRGPVDGPLRWPEVARLALEALGGPLSARDILDWNETVGPHRPISGKTPVRTVNRDLHAAVRRGEPGLAHGEAPGTFVLGSVCPLPACTAPAC